MTAEKKTAGSARPRDLALQALMDRAGNVSAHLARLIQERHPAPADASLARELAFGVLRRRRTLDKLLDAFMQHKTPPPDRVQNVLRIGAYQLTFLQRVPDFAAVNEAVGQISDRSPGVRGFVNGVLRNLARSLSEEQTGPPPRRSDVLPMGPDQFRTLGRAVFAAPTLDPAGYAADAYSLPDDLAKKWVADWGLAKLAELAMHSNARPPVILRVDTDKISVADALARLTASGIRAEPHRNGSSIVIDQPLDVASVEMFGQGLISPQDAMASVVVGAAGLQPGMRVVDLCSSPGTKTVQMAQRMHNEGKIVALDVSAEKLEPVQESCRRCGVSIVETMLAPQAGQLADESWDLVLVDAPCSNTGVLCRRPEARWRFTRKQVGDLVNDQRRLIFLASQMVRSGGTLLYSTCSMEAEENAQVVAHLREREKTFRLVRQEVIWPSGLGDATNWNDGGFFAILRRS